MFDHFSCFTKADQRRRGRSRKSAKIIFTKESQISLEGEFFGKSEIYFRKIIIFISRYQILVKYDISINQKLFRASQSCLESGDCSQTLSSSSNLRTENPHSCCHDTQCWTQIYLREGRKLIILYFDLVLRNTRNNSAENNLGQSKDCIAETFDNFHHKIVIPPTTQRSQI